MVPLAAQPAQVGACQHHRQAGSTCKAVSGAARAAQDMRGPALALLATTAGVSPRQAGARMRHWAGVRAALTGMGVPERAIAACKQFVAQARPRVRMCWLARPYTSFRQLCELACPLNRRGARGRCPARPTRRCTACAASWTREPARVDCRLLSPLRSSACAQRGPSFLLHLLSLPCVWLLSLLPCV